MNTIFNIKTEADFVKSCLETFHYQYENVEIYQRFVNYLNMDISKIKKIRDIPFLPIEMFKNHQILDQTKTAKDFFQSSGTTQINLSKHWIADFQLYERSIEKSFQQFIGNPDEFIFLGLLPNYLERKNASLIYMVNHLMTLSGKPENGYFLYNHKDLFQVLKRNKKQKILLFGVSFALLDFLDYPFDLVSLKLENLTVIETGGMKGRKEEITKDELLSTLQKGFSTEKVYSEYSMTELLSQAYSLGENIYKTPNWMRVLVRNIENPFSYVDEYRTGAINIIDLANRHSCSFIATQDLGKKLPENQFQVLGRIDHSDIRGCSLLVS